MNTNQKHSAISYELVNDLAQTLRDGEAGTWEDVCASVAIAGHPGYGLDLWGEEKANGDKYFSVSLCQNFTEKGSDFEKVLFTAYAPHSDDFEAVLDCSDKVLAHFERSLKEPAEPLHTDGPYSYYSREVMQPLLDALKEGDFQRAAELTPAKYRLCGYQDFEQDYLYEQAGMGWGGQYEHTMIPAGRYPVFVENYSYHEADMQFTNKLKDFRGVVIYLAGDCIADSIGRKPEEYPYPNTVWSSPYAHAVAHAILENKSSIQLLPPFKAVPVYFTSCINGEELTTFSIIDEGLPERMKQNPMGLRNQNSYIHKTLDLSEKARSLYDQFTREYCYSLVRIYGRFITSDNLMCHKAYSSEAVEELIDRGLIQRREGEPAAYELTAKERLHLFHTGQMNSAEREPLKWKEEYERCSKEAIRKAPLDQQIQSASNRSVNDKRSEPAKGRSSGIHEIT